MAVGVRPSMFGLAGPPPAMQTGLGVMPGDQPMPEEPFVFGKGGARLTPEEIARRRELADQMMQADYSPIYSPWQGLARVSQNVLGALQANKAGKADDANAAENRTIAEMLVSDKPDASAVSAALVSPYADERTRGLAEMQWRAMHPKAPAPTEFERALMAANIQPGTPEYADANRRFAMSKADPQVTVTLPGGGIFVGPQSELANVLQGGGGQASGAAGPPAVLPPDFNFDDERGPASAPGGFPGG